ncbi:unnamed protein product [Laminaria digitata]
MSTPPPSLQRLHRSALVGASAKTWNRPLTSGQTPLDPLDHRLRKDVKMLGGILGETIQKHSGEFS